MKSIVLSVVMAASFSSVLVSMDIATPIARSDSMNFAALLDGSLAELEYIESDSESESGSSNYESSEEFVDLNQWYHRIPLALEMPGESAGEKKDILEIGPAVKLKIYHKLVLKDQTIDFPVHKAAAAGQFDALERLAFLGAQMNVYNMQGLTPFHMLDRLDDQEIAKDLAFYFLQRDEGIINKSTRTGITSLCQALESKRYAYARFLIKNKADVAPKQSSQNPLHIAIRHAQPEIVQLLVDKNAPITQKTHLLARNLFLQNELDENRERCADIISIADRENVPTL